MKTSRYDIIIMKCPLDDDIPGIVKKTVFVKDVPYYLHEGWDFASEFDKNMYEKLIKENKQND